jgi:class 3 adenylate cyclase/tetratricopeptide (TPR) repeat protein
LVGFTASSEQADPEDVRARLRPYHERVRAELERFGGTVEKFIGDAVMAVFGAPQAHEDDAERAVRAGLRIVEAIGELNETDPNLGLQVRVGINTGEAVVALAARPELGEGIVTGDVVNTASRLQGVAPVDGIAVSEQTYRQTERVFDYEPLEPVSVRGKSEPLAIYRPLRPRARFGSDVIRTHTTPLVGRELERSLLVGTFDRAAQQRSCQLVTVVGEPGVGKSRLCMELFGHIDELPELVTWRQGRCLPYGDGIAFWALGEIVKAQCGILESDSPQEAEAKLEQSLPPDDPDLGWLKARLGPLVGVGGEPASQQESFAAWRRFCESLAASGPAVLMFEDLHWADEALLAFLEYLADWLEGVPLLLLCTARPELFEQQPSFGATARNAHRINLAPLTDEETTSLIGSLLERAALPAEIQQQLLERAGGNPLYAEEFVRLLADRGELTGAVEVPEGVQALIAARLDTLSPERKALLQDASVLGKVFWAGALAEIGGRDPREIELALHELSRKELVRRARASSMEGDVEYGFWHVLVRDVSYSQIPRGARAVGHRAAADWIERRAGERVDDLADVLAHHYLTALELAQASRQDDETEEVQAAAVRYLALAGERALALDVEYAEQTLARALELAHPDHAERARLLERWAQAAQQQNRLQEARDALDGALAAYRRQGNRVAAGRVLTTLSAVLRQLGDPRHYQAITESLALLEAEPPGAELVAAHAELASSHRTGSAYPDAIVAADRAIELARELGLPEPARALGSRGVARCNLGESQGLADMRRALELAIEQGQGRVAAILYNNIAFVAWQYEGPQAALDACLEGVEFTQRRGMTEQALTMTAGRLTDLAELGQVEQALAEAASRADELQAAGNINFTEPRSLHLRLLAERGECDAAPPPYDLVAAARDSQEPQVCAVAFAAVAQLLLAQDKRQEAQLLLVELDKLPGIRASPVYTGSLARLLRTALALDHSLGERLVDGVHPVTPLVDRALTACRAQLAEAAGDHAEAGALHADAADRWRTFGNVPERAYALLGHGRCLLALAHAGAEVPLTEARDLFASMGYKPALAETEALLAEG